MKLQALLSDGISVEATAALLKQVRQKCDRAVAAGLRSRFSLTQLDSAEVQVFLEHGLDVNVVDRNELRALKISFCCALRRR